MSEENQNEEVILAVLSPGEPVISQEQAEKFQEFVNESLTAKYEEAVAENSPEKEPEPENVITNEKQSATPTADSVAGITAVENGVIGTGKVSRKPRAQATKKEEAKVEKVALFSSRNVTWSGVGKVYRGYNFVTQEQADKWLTRDHARIATPEEVAREFNK